MKPFKANDHSINYRLCCWRSLKPAWKEDIFRYPAVSCYWCLRILSEIDFCSFTYILFLFVFQTLKTQFTATFIEQTKRYYYQWIHFRYHQNFLIKIVFLESNSMKFVLGWNKMFCVCWQSKKIIIRVVWSLQQTVYTIYYYFNSSSCNLKLMLN